jgi:hypothetical protein
MNRDYNRMFAHEYPGSKAWQNEVAMLSQALYAFICSHADGTTINRLHEFFDDVSITKLAEARWALKAPEGHDNGWVELLPKEDRHDS